MSAAALEPGGEEWLQLMTASKVAAVLGLSPWESPFSLWHRMNGTAPATASSAQTERGHYLEAAIVRWFADRHPEWRVRRNRRLFLARRNKRYAATPDGLIYPAGGSRRRLAVLEVKTAARDDEWGRAGSDEVPIYYRAQALWQAHVLNLPRVHFAVLTSYLEFREYVVERDAEDEAVIVGAVESFLASLEQGTPPSVDGSTATYEVVRRLHPDIDREEDVELDVDLARGWIAARRELERAEQDVHLHNSLVLEAMGRARRGLLEGTPLVRRQAKTGGAPFLVPITSRPPRGDS